VTYLTKDLATPDNTPKIQLNTDNIYKLSANCVLLPSFVIFINIKIIQQFNDEKELMYVIYQILSHINIFVISLLSLLVLLLKLFASKQPQLSNKLKVENVL